MKRMISCIVFIVLFFCFLALAQYYRFDGFSFSGMIVSCLGFIYSIIKFEEEE